MVQNTIIIKIKQLSVPWLGVHKERQIRRDGAYAAYGGGGGGCDCVESKLNDSGSGVSDITIKNKKSVKNKQNRKDLQPFVVQHE